MNENLNIVVVQDTPEAENETAAQQNVKEKKLLPVFAAVTLVLFIVMFVVIGMLNSKISDLSERLEESEDYIMAMNSKVYEYAEPDDVIHLNDSFYGDMWMPVMENVPLNTHDYTNLVLDERNRYEYYINGEQASVTGIDVSYHQGKINWEAVAADGIDFVIVRAGYRGYETGRINKDERVDEYITGAMAAGLDVGAYFYSQAVTPEEAAEEARFMCEILSPYEVTYPVIFDWELPEDDTARTVDLASETLNKCAVAFCNEVSAAGYTPMIYSGLRMALNKFDMRGLCQYDFWYVEYKDGYNPPAYPYQLHMWQYASDGRVDGIDGDVDMNISFVDYRKQYDALKKVLSDE